MSLPLGGTVLSRWTATLGVSVTLDRTRIEVEHAYNFAFYLKHSQSETLLFYIERDLVNSKVINQFEYLKKKSSRIWPRRIPSAWVKTSVKASMKAVLYSKYSVKVPRSNGKFKWRTQSALRST